jgi:hypothetical protein
MGLLKSVPLMGDRVKDELTPIGGLPPDLLARRRAAGSGRAAHGPRRSAWRRRP